ncbi:Diadenosine tetraphosphate (Ap4A) hydrolase [Geoalkalibacter ferrihydriticus]|uniref:HIT family hydrolase n=2 Tax=Geoalkalibacter ferrihydriticus TaxID=392333 RepID=A0A0C2HLB1_9BACT|nr:HIT domain-containing protein [Geoalkalibacter ferrihydriticus]KIH75780.1 HIT family hydrolase [Geoalkalibacter ferrihydriticus DSM 17813]SDM64731.1 Diadenosine tetraphosphate (Ap4A) hydrolase [Geoalkalibacter ferrihydriticus]
MDCLWAPWRMTYINAEPVEDCIFCLRDLQEQDSKRLVLYRGEHTLIIMNRFPYTNGHLMVAPFRHSAELDDFNEAEILEMYRLVALARRVLGETSHPDGFNIGLNLGRAAGAGVTEHLHYHVVPRWSGDTNFMPVFADVRVVPQHLEETYALLRKAFRQYENRPG